MKMSELFGVLEGGASSGWAAETPANVQAVQNYADACGEGFARSDAELIANVGKHGLDERVSGDGRWSRMRHEAKEALQA
jgi:hypothetical protein